MENVKKIIVLLNIEPLVKMTNLGKLTVWPNKPTPPNGKIRITKFTKITILRILLFRRHVPSHQNSKTSIFRILDFRFQISDFLLIRQTMISEFCHFEVYKTIALTVVGNRPVTTGHIVGGGGPGDLTECSHCTQKLSGDVTTFTMCCCLFCFDFFFCCILVLFKTSSYRNNFWIEGVSVQRWNVESINLQNLLYFIKRTIREREISK